jgi:hypothetical protein
MRRFGYIATALTAAALVAAGTAAAATADTAVPSPVLTINKLAGPPVRNGDILTSSLSPGTTLSLTTAPTGGVGLFCQQSVWGGAVVANPVAPGTAAINLLRPFTISACTDNAPTVTGVVSVAVNSLPNILQVVGTPAFPLMIAPSPPFVFAVTLTTTGQPQVVCTYQQATVLNGNTSLGLAPWRFTNQPFILVSGPLPVCGTSNTSFFSAAYGPVTDTSQGNAAVYVNSAPVSSPTPSNSATPVS